MRRTITERCGAPQCEELHCAHLVDFGVLQLAWIEPDSGPAANMRESVLSLPVAQGDLARARARPGPFTHSPAACICTVAHGAHRSRTNANIRAEARLPRLLRNRAVPSKPFARMRCAVPCIRLRRGDARVSRRATGRMDGGSARRDTRSALSSVAGRTPSTFPRQPRLRRRTSGLVSVGPRADGPVPHSGGACRNPNGTSRARVASQTPSRS